MVHCADGKYDPLMVHCALLSWYQEMTNMTPWWFTVLSSPDIRRWQIWPLDCTLCSPVLISGDDKYEPLMVHCALLSWYQEITNITPWWSTVLSCPAILIVPLSSLQTTVKIWNICRPHKGNRPVYTSVQIWYKIWLVHTFNVWNIKRLLTDANIFHIWQFLSTRKQCYVGDICYTWASHSYN